jgi:multiple sugar transport system ATP-binding protein
VVNDVPPKDRDIAMVFQSYALYPHMSVYDNMAFGLKLRKTPKTEIDKRVKEAAEMLSIGHLLDRKPKALSGGQRQRAALARAIVRHPRVFLMDEPLSNLDAKLRLTMRAQLKHIQKKLQTTTIYVTHDQIEAMTLADRVAIMDKGKIQQLGTPDEVYNDPANVFVAGFIGSPPMNLIQGSLENGTFVAPDTRVPKAGKGSKAKVTLGIRPEDVSVSKTNSGHLNSKVYSIEPTGDQTLLAVEQGGKLIVARADRNYRQSIDTPVSLNFDTDRVYLFDTETGQRIRG